MNTIHPARPRRAGFLPLKHLRNRAALASVCGTLLLGSLGLIATPGARASDSDDIQTLQREVTAMSKKLDKLQRELDAKQGEAKGKNVEAAEPPAFVIKPGSPQERELVISGDFRLRYNYDTESGQSRATDNDSQRSREQFRLRLALDYKFSDHFYFGIAAQTALSADSGNSTFTEGFDNYGLYLWRVFLGWKPNENVDLVVGKFANPFYSNTELLFDADISPTGLAQKLKFPISPKLELAVNLGEFIFYDNNENAERDPTKLANGTTTNPAYVRGGNNSSDAYLVNGQIVGTYKPSNRLTFTAAAGFLTYIDNGGTNSPGAVTVGFNSNGAGNSTGQAGNVLQNSGAFNSANATRNLWLGNFTGDVKFSLGALKAKVYTDAVYNFRGGERDAEEYNLPQLDGTTDKLAFDAGFTIGSDYTLKKQGDFLFLAEYRQVGLGSLDPNLNDSDFNLGRLGFRGIKFAGSYAIKPWLFVTLTTFFSNNLTEEKNVNLGVANFNTSKVIYFDLTTRF